MAGLWVGLAPIKREGGFYVIDPNHPLSGRTFMSETNDLATVIKKKKNGLFMCKLDSGFQFDLPERKLTKAVLNYEANNK